MPWVRLSMSMSWLTLYGAIGYGGFDDFNQSVVAITKACLYDKLLSLDTPSLFADKARDI